MGTGKFDKNGTEIKIGDIVHFRADGLCGKGVVYLADGPDRLGADLFRIRDTTPGKRFGRIYPFYPDAKYRIDGHEETESEKLERWIGEHDCDDYCKYCDYECGGSGVKSSPNGPIYPPCADFDDAELLEHLNTEEILKDIELEEQE